MASNFMIYGANGYTGRLCAEEAARRGLQPILAGRTERAVREVAEPLGLPWRAFSLEDPDAVSQGLHEVAAVLHCAGPFSATSAPMLAGCVRTTTHYLDITGEIDVFESASFQHDRWAGAGIAVIPGVGFDVVPTDCLAALVARDVPDATHLKLAIAQNKGGVSPGTTKTTLENLPLGCRVRQNGVIVRRPWGADTMTVPFYDEPRETIAIPWGDVSTALHSTGIPNIEVYYAAPKRLRELLPWASVLAPVFKLKFVQTRLKQSVERKVHGPTEAERALGDVQLYAQATGPNGGAKTMLMRTPEAYNFTVDAALTSVEALLANPIEPGYYTPSLAFGPEFVLGLQGVECWDV